MRSHRLYFMFLIMIAAPVLLLAELFPNLGGQRVGTSAAQFLKIGVGARSVAMGESYVAIANDAEALFWNPAGISQFNKNDVFFTYNQWFSDIQILYSGAVFHLNSVNTIGAFFTALTTDPMKETTELEPFGTGREFIYGDIVAGLSYARNMTNKFSFGVTLKYFQETLADLKMDALLFDLGTYYKTGWKSTRFGVSVSNFTSDMGAEGSYTYTKLDNEIVEVTKFQEFTPPIIFRIGLAAEAFDSKKHKLTWSFQLNHPNDNSENINLGAEYLYHNVLALRGGYITGRTDRDVSFGFGLNIPVGKTAFRIDYSYAKFGWLGFVNQYTFHILL